MLGNGCGLDVLMEALFERWKVHIGYAKAVWKPTAIGGAWLARMELCEMSCRYSFDANAGRCGLSL